MKQINSSSKSFRKLNPHIFNDGPGVEGGTTAVPNKPHDITASEMNSLYAVSEEVPKDERAMHEQIKKECIENGWIAFHGRMDKKTGRTLGENDFHCLLPGGIVIFVECKTKTGKLSADQRATEAWMKKLGHAMHVVTSISEFRALCAKALSGSILATSKSFPEMGQSGLSQNV